MAPPPEKTNPEFASRGHELDDAEIQQVESLNLKTDYDDPHRAALEANPDKPETLSLTTICAIFFLGFSTVAPISLGILVVPGVLVEIGTALGNTTNISWIPGAWAISSSVSFCVAGRLSDIFGRRYIIMLGQLFSIIGGIIAATGKSTETVIVGSTLLGFACGLVLVLYAAIPELLPFKYRGLGLAWTEFALYVPWGAVAVLLGNLLIRHASWRWCYYIAIIYGTFSLVGTAVFYFPPSNRQVGGNRTKWQKFKELDFIGLLLYSAGLTVMLIGFAWAGTPSHPWKSASVVAPIIIGAVSLCCCFAYDWLVCDQEKAFFPARLFRQYREFTVSLVVVFVAGMIFYAMSSLAPSASFYIFSNDGMQVGIISLPNGLGQMIGSVVMPSLLHKTKNPKLHIISAVFIQTLFTALYACSVPSHKAAWMAFQFFGQGCFAWITVTTLINASLHVRQSDLGLAVGIIGTFRSAGGSIGDAVFTTILNGVVGNQLAPRIAEAATAHGYNPKDLADLIPAVIENGVGVPHAFTGVPGVTAAVEAATSRAFHDAYAYAFQKVFYSTIPFGVIALIAALFVADAGKYMTNHTSVHLQKKGTAVTLDKDEKDG